MGQNCFFLFANATTRLELLKPVRPSANLLLSHSAPDYTVTTKDGHFVLRYIATYLGNISTRFIIQGDPGHLAKIMTILPSICDNFSFKKSTLCLRPPESYKSVT